MNTSISLIQCTPFSVIIFQYNALADTKQDITKVEYNVKLFS